jgi:hypothetical protein
VDTINVASAAIVSGKLYLSLSNGLVIDCGQAQGPQGLAGPPGPPGPNGRAGTDGNSVLHGPGLPLPTDGKQGDFYVDTADLLFYGPKTGSGWGTGVALRPQARNMTLPTGMKAQQGDPIYPRVFAGAMAGGGGGGTVVVGGNAAGSATPIIIHGNPLPAGAPIAGTPAGPGGTPPAVAATPAVWTPIAVDNDGHAMIVDVYAEGPDGSTLVEVGALMDSKGRTGYSQVYEVRTGTPPNLSFQVDKDSNGKLRVSMYSDQGLSLVEGRVMYV